MNPILIHDSLSEDFENEDEDLDTDLSGICIQLIKDVHDESLEMTVEVFGRDGIDSAPIISEFIYDPEAYLGKNFDDPRVCPKCLVTIFEDTLIDLIMKKNLKVIWNRSFQTEATIDFANLHKTPKLIAEDQ